MNLEVNGCEDMVWIQLAQDKIISYRSDHDNEN
jgi:sulfur transfer protein SufE